MPRGRPRKNPVPSVPAVPVDSNVENSVETVELPMNTVKSQVKIQKENKYPLCECCKSPMYSSPRRINLTYLLGVAPYHFKTKNSMLALCPKCVGELSRVVDEWLIKHGAEKKFEEI